MNVVLAPLRAKIFRGYVGMLSVYGVAGALLFTWALSVATNITPRTLHRNYDSIDAALRIENAWNSLGHPQEHPGPTTFAEAKKAIDEALRFAAKNITEPGERELVAELEKAWGGGAGAPWNHVEKTRSVRQAVDRLVEINRAGMFLAAEQAHRLKIRTLWVTLVFFLAGLLFAFFRADAISTALADPLKRIAEALRAKPRPGEKLKLPSPNSLELRILIQEIRGLWERVSEASALDLEKIMRQSGKLRAVLASVDDAVLVIEEGGRVTHCNLRMLELVGLDEARVVGQSWRDLGTASNNYMRLRERLEPRVSAGTEIVLETEEGTRSYAIRCRSVVGPDGTDRAYVYLLENVTEKRKQERLKAEFVGVLSHELRTPLQSLGTAAELLVRQRTIFDDETQLLVDTISEDVVRIRNVVNDFVQVSQLSRYSLQLHFERIDLDAALERWLKPFRVMAQEAKLRIVQQSTLQDALVDVDPLKFAWIVANLLSNAVRVTPEGGDVVVTLFDAGDSVSLSVADGGPGVPEEFEHRIFEPYFKATSGAKPGGFLGIGLTIAREMAEAHGGTLRFERGVSGGAVFTVTWPRNTGVAT